MCTNNVGANSGVRTNRRGRPTEMHPPDGDNISLWVLPERPETYIRTEISHFPDEYCKAMVGSVQEDSVRWSSLLRERFCRLEELRFEIDEEHIEHCAAHIDSMLPNLRSILRFMYFGWDEDMVAYLLVDRLRCPWNIVALCKVSDIYFLTPTRTGALTSL
ncbi:hypothetical protein BC628DRAFT_839987 [Trametes gibbosa]|nr:hypothetical protein BC628DRAFT_839987 [Trametes gibbosa]